MRKLGFLLVLLGIASSVVQFVDPEMAVLESINHWGEGVAWGIRAGCVVLGALLVKAGKPKKQ